MSETWSLVYEGLDLGREGLREALCALGNGRFVTRGAGEESCDDGTHYPGTYFAGLYQRLESAIGGKRISNEDLVNLPNWLPLSFRPVPGEWIDLDAQQVSGYRQELDMKRGVLRRWFTVEDGQQRQTRVATTRLVSMASPHLAGIKMEILPLNWGGPMEIRTALNGGVTNSGVDRYRELSGDHWAMEASGGRDSGLLWLHVRTSSSGIGVALGARNRVVIAGQAETGIVWSETTHGTMAERTAGVVAHPGCPVCVEKIVALRTIRDRGLTDLLSDAIQDAKAAPGFAELLSAHSVEWKRLWDLFDVQVDVAPGSDLAPYSIQLILRLHTFHLLQTVSRHSIEHDVSVPARGLHGEAYRGHIFWDEMFVLPFYTLRDPEIARSLLLYRARRLEAARANAAAEGYAGAMFPWQSGSSGREETQVIHLNPRSGTWDPDRSRLQRHVNAAIALSVWRYVEQTGDEAFLRSHGAEILAEIARFWRSLLTWNQAAGRFEICGVMGPDEFHEAYPDATKGGLDNNAYTNVMAAWCLARAADAMDRVDAWTRETLVRRLRLGESEVANWRTVSAQVFVPVTTDGRIEAFSGYDDLKEFDWSGYRAKHRAIGRLDRILKAEGETPDRYKVAKQADLCMLFYLLEADELGELLASLGIEMSDETARDAIRYYRDRTSHGSTLSHLVFAAILDDEDAAWEHFVTALRSDIDDIQGGTTPEGIHTAVMAGTIRQVIERYAGLRTKDGRLLIHPDLPQALDAVRCSVRVQGIPVRVRVDRESIEAIAPEGTYGEIEIEIEGRRSRLVPGGRVRFRLDPKTMVWVEDSPSSAQ